LSFDLDADRFGLMLGGVVWKGDVMMLPIYEEQLKRKPHTPVRIDARTSMIVDEAVKRWGGTSITQAIGHSKVKRGMDLDLAEEAKRAGHDDVDRYVQENPDVAETFQGEFSLHLFRFKPEINDEGVYVGTPVDDAIDFACYFVHAMQRRGAAQGRPCLQIPEYLDMLHREGIIGDTYRYPENNIEIRTAYDPLLKKNLGHAAYELFTLIARPGERITWIDDGVSAIAEDAKLMLRFSNTSPKVTMKCDAKREAWIQSAERLLSVYFAITDYLTKHRDMPDRYRTISTNENALLYEVFQKRAHKKLEDIRPLPLEDYVSEKALKEALEKEY
jgi:phosphomannomutase